jgi:aminoglycoside/choline kinase family phosphotransferase
MSDGDARITEIRDWLATLGWPRACRLEPASADASFRRYFRAWGTDGTTRVVMDAPPEREDTAPYLKVTGLLAACGVHVPEVIAANTRRGLLLLEDLGQEHMLAGLQRGVDAGPLYAAALASLEHIQLRGASGAASLPAYDRAALLREMQLLPDWYCARHLQLPASSEDDALLAQCFAFLVRAAQEQPVVLVHRDYHSRNLMLTATRSPGVIDFQDAVAGPVGYDLVSLLKDCYIGWPRERVEGWVEDYRLRLRAGGLAAGASSAQFLRWFDLIGLQRHIKVLGIFARLYYRDGKSGYLGDLPRTLAYVLDTAARYTELRDFSAWARRRLQPGLATANARVLAASSA